MFIIGGLLTVKVLQSRHPDINAYAFIAFFCFAIVIFLTMIGIVSDMQLQNKIFTPPLFSQYFSRLNPESTRVILFLVLITAAVIFFTSFYNHHQLTKLWTNFKGIIDTQKPTNAIFISAKCCRWAKALMCLPVQQQKKTESEHLFMHPWKTTNCITNHECTVYVQCWCC